MIHKAVQQFQIRLLVGMREQAKDALKAMKDAGYDGIELCGWLIRPLAPELIELGKDAGLEMQSCGDVDWKMLVKESGLIVVSIHEDIDSILASPESIIEEAKEFGTEYIVVTGMWQFDYSNKKDVYELAERLNEAGKLLEKEGIHLLYHNHNCELRKIDADKTAFQALIEKTDPRYVNFEFDSYWPTEAGCDAMALMDMLGSRMKLYHINDRGFRVDGPTASIIESNSMELGYGNMNLKMLVNAAKKYGVEAVILESHTNWVDNSPVKSLQLSAKFMNENV